MELPELPPGYHYRAENEHKNHSDAQYGDIDILSDEPTRETKTSGTGTYGSVLQAWVDTKGKGYLREPRGYEKVFEEQFNSAEQALQVIAARLWLGMTEKE